MVRVRFAPSPTGFLHVGGVRTALFNWLFAKKQKGTFILRIEDTDLGRSTKESEQEILDSLRWCGLHWDEGPDIGGDYGPYRQMERYEKGMYTQTAQELIDKQRAYYSITRQSDPKTEIERLYYIPEKYQSNDYRVTIKLAVIPGNTEFDDILKGRLLFDNQTIEDFIIVKSNGVPVYNFAAVVDDAQMKITHVIRGEDHISNTPRQIMLYRALGLEHPIFMHLPLILGADKTPLSKRHGGTSVAFFRREGYLAQGLMNYLALLGWTVDEEIFNMVEKVESFSLQDITNKSVVFDYQKLEWVNGKHIRAMALKEVVAEFFKWIDFTQTSYPEKKKAVQNYTAEYIEKLLSISYDKTDTLVQLYTLIRPLLIVAEELEYEDEWIRQYLAKPESVTILSKVIEKIATGSIATYEEIGRVLIEVATTLKLSKKAVFQTVRGALTGKLITPGLYEMIVILGKEDTIQRLTRAEAKALTVLPPADVPSDKASVTLPTEINHLG